MSSSKEGPAILDELFGPVLTLGEAVERKVDGPENNEEAEKSGKISKLCSSCEKESDTLELCDGCRCIWYCGADCKNGHRREHEKECTLIKEILDKRGAKIDLGTEEDLGPLPDLPAQEECPICMRVLPLHARLHTYSDCCGKILCRACDHQHTHSLKNNERPAKRGQQTTPAPLLTCAFCRTTLPESDEEQLARIVKRVELKDPYALHAMAGNYVFGMLGLPVDHSKCIDLLREAADLGCSVAQYQLGEYHRTGSLGLEQNEGEALRCYEKAAENGHVPARNYLSYMVGMKGDYVAALRHSRLAASGGYRNSMAALIAAFDDGLLHHGDLAEPLQAFYCSRAELRSEHRDKYIEHLKKTGEYKAEYEL